jgi:ComF family protein
MLTNHIISLRDTVLDLLLPPRCEVCGTLQEPIICEPCWLACTPITAPICRQCGLPLDPLARTTGYCVDCLDAPPPFDAARAAGIYAGALRRAIHVYKYEMVRALARPLAEFIVEHVTLPFPLDCLCPVPLHPARQRMRGFNQSHLLAERLGSAWRLPVETGLLQRVRDTAPQMQLPPEERRTNIRGAFTADAAARHRGIGLVDDVFTTGSTLRECSRMLKHAGAERVLVLTLARALPQVR